MLQRITLITSIIDSDGNISLQDAFLKFKTLDYYNKKENYIIQYSNNRNCWNVYQLL
jgi:hypothetical protein